MQTEPVKIATSPFSLLIGEKYAQTIKEVLLLFLIKTRSFQVERIGFTEPEKENIQLLKLLPPAFKWNNQTNLQPSEFIWLRLVHTLLKNGFDQQAILRFKSWLFSSHTGYIEKDEEEEYPLTPIQLTYLENLIFYLRKTGEDIILYFSKKGDLSLFLTYNEQERKEAEWIGISLKEFLLNDAPGRIRKESSFYTQVDKAEIELLKTTRRESVRRLVLQKPNKGAFYKWDLSTIEQGVTTAKEIHELTQQSISGYGEFTITGNGQSNRIPYKRTTRIRYT